MKDLSMSTLLFEIFYLLNNKDYKRDCIYWLLSYFTPFFKKIGACVF